MIVNFLDYLVRSSKALKYYMDKTRFWGCGINTDNRSHGQLLFKIGFYNNFAIMVECST